MQQSPLPRVSNLGSTKRDGLHHKPLKCIIATHCGTTGLARARRAPGECQHLRAMSQTQTIAVSAPLTRSGPCATIAPASADRGPSPGFPSAPERTTPLGSALQFMQQTRHLPSSPVRNGLRAAGSWRDCICRASHSISLVYEAAPWALVMDALGGSGRTRVNESDPGPRHLADSAVRMVRPPS